MKLKHVLEGFVGTVDVYENVADFVGCALVWDCHTMGLTEEGKKKFEVALNYEVESINNEYLIMDTEKSVPNHNDYEFYDYDTLPPETQNLTDLIRGIAGYCSPEEWEGWFYDNKGEMK